MLVLFGTVHADPRDIAPPPVPLTPEERAARLAQHRLDMDAWLRMLEGRFRIEGTMSNRPVKGKADCIGIGIGAGVGDSMQNPFPSIMESAGGSGLDMYWYRVSRDATGEEFNQPFRRGPGGLIELPKNPMRPRCGL
jgi:hypothetical protein